MQSQASRGPGLRAAAAQPRQHEAAAPAAPARGPRAQPAHTPGPAPLPPDLQAARPAAQMQEGGKVVTALAVTFAVGVATGWLLNTYTRKSLDALLKKLQDKVGKM
ncbi:hypothetical protein Rsub_04110 [Raphidocelis subcapitata]|uniref:Uncharacterized protein n=1 Tax=Raphidocelis subcapitata TaxID=307507 RepID=A0A2V0P0K4_9CHLO|nr:hypothetical protein Rsub_04110 [Raphidocelis subcapitata]|eukprot:GBF91370.1 hypothetical protein Rsub_04110 [Raphidocelis subcapitata]